MRVQLFGILAEKAGSGGIELQGASTDALREELHRQLPATRDLLYVIAVDRRIIEGNHILQGDEEVAILPPFAGG